jgi:hypothetical protein
VAVTLCVMADLVSSELDWVREAIASLVMGGELQDRVQVVGVVTGQSA